MRSTLCGAMVLAMLSTASAQQRYDAKLEQAAMDVIARKIGGLRSGFDFKHTVQARRSSASNDKAPKIASWRTVAPERTQSITVGSIQTYSSDGPHLADPSPVSARSSRKLPHVLKF